MPTNQFNTGTDSQVVIRHPLAGADGRLDLPLLTEFDAKPNFHDIKSSCLDGFTRTQHIPDNIELSFSVDRASSDVDDFLVALITAYRAVGRVPDGQVFHYVREIDGSTTTTVYEGVSFKPGDLGTWKKDDRVGQKLSATAMTMRRV